MRAAIFLLSLLTAAPKPQPAACWSWRTLTYVDPPARYVCLRAPDGAYVHDGGKVVTEFCDAAEGPVRAKAIEHHLPICAGSKPEPRS